MKHLKSYETLNININIFINTKYWYTINSENIPIFWKIEKVNKKDKYYITIFNHNTKNKTSIVKIPDDEFLNSILNDKIQNIIRPLNTQEIEEFELGILKQKYNL